MFGDESQDFDVVVNAEEQYSIWPCGRALPAGWDLAGFRGPKSDCLAHIDIVWTDITPLSARQEAFDPACDIIGDSADEERADLRVPVVGLPELWGFVRSSPCSSVEITAIEG